MYNIVKSNITKVFTGYLDNLYQIKVNKYISNGHLIYGYSIQGMHNLRPAGYEPPLTPSDPHP